MKLILPLLCALTACGSGGAGDGEVCSPPAACPSSASRSYRACTSADHSRCSLRTSDGTTFSCVSCADCSDATLKASNWCASSSSSSNGGGGGGDGGVVIGGGTSPDPICATLLACLAQNEPSVFAGALQTYGPSGACWQNASTSQACHQACQGSLTQYEQSGQCCLADTDCHGATPTCDLATHACVACRSECCAASDCAGRGNCDSTSHTCSCFSDTQCTKPGATYCDPQTHACGGCLLGCCSANECTNPTMQFCDPSAHQCVGCIDSSQCGVPFINPQVCDSTTHQCVGCVADADCTNSLLSLGRNRCSAQQTCVECLNDGQCATGHCSSDGTCVCLADGDCGGGGRLCHTATGVCDACANDAQCTDAANPHCGLNRSGVKSCGQCATNAQCVSNVRCLDQICTNKECFTSDDCGSIGICNANGQCQ